MSVAINAVLSKNLIVRDSHYLDVKSDLLQIAHFSWREFSQKLWRKNYKYEVWYLGLIITYNQISEIQYIFGRTSLQQPQDELLTVRSSRQIIFLTVKTQNTCSPDFLVTWGGHNMVLWLFTCITCSPGQVFAWPGEIDRWDRWPPSLPPW